MARVRRQAAEWAALIDQWRQSGLSLPAFCQRHGLSTGHDAELGLQARAQTAPSKTARREAQAAPSTSLPHPPRRPRSCRSGSSEAVAGREASDRSGVEIVLGPGRRVVVGPGFDAETLRRVVAVLEGRPC